MKLKLKINNIESGADKITICAYNKQNVIEEFTKEDYGENWENLIGKEIEINPYFIGDVDQLIVTGTKDHQLSWDNEDKKQRWKEYASDKFDISISPYGRDDLDPEKTIKVKNYKNLDKFNISYLNYKELKKFDLSELENYYSNISYSDSTKSLYNKIVKLPNPKEEELYLVSQTAEGMYTGLTDVSNLDTKNITNMNYFLKNNTLIEDISNFKFDNLNEGKSAFENCTNLKKLPPLIFPKLSSCSDMFKNCKKLEKIENIDFSKSSKNFSNYFYSIFEETNINVEHITLGNTYINLPSGNFGVVYIGNAESTFSVSSSNNTTEYSFVTEGKTSVKAFPSNLMCGKDNRPKAKISTPPEDIKIAWIDYIDPNNEGPCLKSIVQLQNCDTVIKTLKNTFTGQLEVPNPFVKNSEYPYKLELLDFEAGVTLGSNSYAKLTKNDKNKYFIDLNLTNIKDSSKIILDLRYNNPVYSALIDGEEFKGRAFGNFLVKYTITFNIEENLDFGFELVEDSSDDTTE